MRTDIKTRRVCPHTLARRLFYLCCITYIIGAFGRLTYSAVMVELIASGSMDKSQAGLIGTALFIVLGVSQVIGGIIGDRISPKKTIFVGVFGSAALNLGMGLAGQYGLMLLLWSCNGVFQSLIWSPVARIFAEQLPPDMRRSACSTAAATYPIATVIVYLMASLLLRALGWRSVFLLSAALMFAAAAVWYIRMTWFEKQIASSDEVETLLPRAADAGTMPQRQRLVPLLIVSGVLVATISSMTHGMLRDGIQTWLPSLMTENFHVDTAASVALDIILPVVNIAGVFVTKAIAKRHIQNELRGAAGFFAVTVVVLCALGFVCDTSALASLLLLTVASTCMVGANVMLINLMPIHFGAVGRASSVTGILNCAAYVGSAISSFGIGAVADDFGWTSAIWMWVAFAVLALLCSLLDAKRWGKYISSHPA